MPRRRLAPPLLLLFVLLAGVAAVADDDGPGGDALRRAPQVLRGAEHGVGRRVPDLAFTDLEGTSGRLSDLADRDAIVLAWTNVGCPICKKYAPKLRRLGERLDPKRVALLLVNASPQDTPDAMRAAVARYGFTCRYVVDHDRALSRALGATTTAEVFVLDKARTLVYRGALDDQYGVGWTRAAPESEYVEDALRAVLAGERPKVEATTAPGCVLALDPSASPDPAAPTWHGDVSRIFQRRCMSCHRESQPAPFPLTTLADVKGNAGMVRWAVESRRMPPWFAGAKSLPMRHDPTLADDERDLVLAWIDAGCPAGDPADAPLPRTWVEGFTLGEPDAVIDLPSAHEVPAEGVLPYMHVAVPTDFPEDKWISAYEIRVSAPEVVHHVLAFLHYPKDHPHRSEQQEVRGGVGGYFALYAPGGAAYRMPPGTAKRLPRGGTLVFQIHYTPNGEAARNRTKIGLWFSEKPPEHQLISTGIHNHRFKIPAGHPNYPVRASKVVPVRARVFGFMPHMHLRGKAFRFEAVLPDGSRRMLLDVPAFDFNWQLTYQLRDPIELPAGTRIETTGWYDNSADNPANPDPTRDVPWGEQTFDEMQLGYVEWHPVK